MWPWVPRTSVPAAFRTTGLSDRSGSRRPGSPRPKHPSRAVPLIRGFERSVRLCFVVFASTEPSGASRRQPLSWLPLLSERGAFASNVPPTSPALQGCWCVYRHLPKFASLPRPRSRTPKACMSVAGGWRSAAKPPPGKPRRSRFPCCRQAGARRRRANHTQHDPSCMPGLDESAIEGPDLFDHIDHTSINALWLRSLSLNTISPG